MSAKVYVGNLSWNTTDDTLRQAFSDFGQVMDVRLPYFTYASTRSRTIYDEIR